MTAYRIDVADAHAHLFRVTVSVAQPAAEQVVSLPVWVPGSYLVREFARHLSQLEARQGRQARSVEQLDKASWRVRCRGRATLTLSYLVYAFDTSVRTAFLDAARGFFNGTSVFVRVHGAERAPQQVAIGTLPRGWRVATSMPAVRGEPGRWHAADYDELVDHPFELGTFWHGRFEAAGVPHEFAVAGALPGFDGERLLADARRLCEAQIAFWGGAPFPRYVFLLNAVDEGYGGLEHRASTALIASRRDLPRRGQGALPPDGLVTLLGLVSHEYFHAWNVKRLKPAEFAALDYTRENYTRLLWFFEGFTSYYDDLLLRRAGLIDDARYLRLLAKAVNGVQGMPGRHVQSVAEASFDAWVKYYRSDENTPNATVSYYTKGSLVALALDLRLRAGRSSLDAVMRALWEHSGGGPVGEDDILGAVERAGGRAVADDLRDWVHGTGELPLAALLERAGVQWKVDAPTPAQRLGLRVAESALTGVQVKQVLRSGAAEAAGVSAGDELLGVDGWRLRRLDDLNALVAPDAAFELLLSRDQRLRRVRVPAGRGDGAVTLAPAGKPARAALALRRAWLDG
ncbi:MAG TPA: PDZ domain-containing protein [Burkholderiaceae bacterium]